MVNEILDSENDGTSINIIINVHVVTKLDNHAKIT